VNLNVSNVPITEPGAIRATVEIDSTPPLKREFVMDVTFEPPETVAPG
jgi:hypothetical protein